MVLCGAVTPDLLLSNASAAGLLLDGGELSGSLSLSEPSDVYWRRRLRSSLDLSQPGKDCARPGHSVPSREARGAGMVSRALRRGPPPGCSPSRSSRWRAAGAGPRLAIAECRTRVRWPQRRGLALLRSGTAGLHQRGRPAVGRDPARSRRRRRGHDRADHAATARELEDLEIAWHLLRARSGRDGVRRAGDGDAGRERGDRRSSICRRGSPRSCSRAAASDGSWDYLDDQALEVDGSTLTVTATTTHFSTVIAFGAPSAWSSARRASRRTWGSRSSRASASWSGAPSGWISSPMRSPNTRGR